MFGGPGIVNVFQSMANKMQHYTVFYFCKLLYMFWVDPPPIIKNTTLYLQHLLFVKPLLLSAAIAADSSNGWQIPDAVDTVLCSWWWVGDPPETFRAVYRNKKLCNVASCWPYFGIQRKYQFFLLHTELQSKKFKHPIKWLIHLVCLVNYGPQTDRPFNLCMDHA